MGKYGDERFYEWDEKCACMIDEEVMMIRSQMINDIDDDNAGDDNDHDEMNAYDLCSF